MISNTVVMPKGGSAIEQMPNSREYRALKRAAREKVDSGRYDTDAYRLECQFIVRVMGELGLRAGELSHITDDWVDFDQLEINIPSYDECTKGRDGGPCGYCKKRARRRAEHAEITYETALRDRWEPKNETSARSIWFGWNEELVEIIDEYLYKNGKYPHSRVSVNRRVTDIAEACDMVGADEIDPHSLRAHAAMFHAKRGVRAFQLKEFMGWSDVDGAMDYIRMASDDVRSELKRVHSDSFRR